MKPKYTVAVTGLNNTDNPGPGVPVIRALRESNDFDVKIIGLVYENLEPGIYLKGLTDKIYQVPYPSVGTDEYLDRIKYIHSKENIDIIIPNFDAELFTFIKAENELSNMGIKTFLPRIEQFKERHKSKLEYFGIKYGFDVPHSKPISTLGEISLLQEEFTYPVMVKGKFYDAYIAYNQGQVIEHFNKISAKWGVPVIIQEFVKGTEVNVVALGDGKGNTIGAVPMRKLYITDKGKAWSGITLDDKKLLEITKDLIRKTKWRGGMELEFIKTPEGKYYILEINPRIPAWVYLAVGSGQNLPEALVKAALGEQVEAFETYEVGKMFVRYSYDIIVDLKIFEKLATTGEL